MTKRKICVGTGRIPIESRASKLYPICPVCGKEFSGQGRRYASRPNYWVHGCPKHYPKVKSRLAK